MYVDLDFISPSDVYSRASLDLFLMLTVSRCRFQRADLGGKVSGGLRLKEERGGGTHAYQRPLLYMHVA